MNKKSVKSLAQVSCKPISYGVVQTGDPNMGTIPCVRVVDLTSRKMDLSLMIKTSEAINNAYKRTILEPNEILFALRGEIGAVHLATQELAGANITRGVARIAPDTSQVIPEFLLQYLQSPDVQKELLLRKNGSALQEISIDQLRKLRVEIPDLKVQEHLSSLFKAWDTGTSQLSLLIEHKEQLKQALKQRLLTGSVRFPEFEGTTWRTVSISEILQLTIRYVDWDDNTIYNLASVRRNSQGLFWRGSLTGRDIKVKKLHKLCENDFLISHIQAAYGAMGRVPSEFDGGYVSDMYSILTPRLGAEVDIRFIDLLSQTPLMRQLILLSSNGFFAERLRLNFDPLQFLKQRIQLPSTLAEQQKISNALYAAEEEIQLLKAQLERLGNQKRGLMQRLLSGDIQVPVQNL